MNLRVYCASLFWCLVVSQNHYDQTHKRENQNSPRAFPNDHSMAFYLQNNKQGPVYVTTESTVGKRPSFEYTGTVQRNTHGGKPIQFNKNSPFHPDRNKDIVVSPYDQSHTEISERSDTEKPKEEWLFDNAGNKASRQDNQFTFEGSRTYFQETNSTHIVSHKSQETFIDSYGNRHEISKTGSKKTSEENANSYAVTKSNSNNRGISESVDRNRFSDYRSDESPNRDFHFINRLENNQKPASKIQLHEMNFHQASGTINFGDFKIAENSPDIQRTGTLQFGNFKIQNNQPITKITRTFYVNGVKVDDNNASIDSIINSLLINSYLNRTNNNMYNQKINTENQYNPNIDLNVHLSGDNKSRYVLNHLSNGEPYKTNFGNNLKSMGHQSDNYKDNREPYFNQQPDIDIRIGHEIPVLGKLARLREKGKNINNATSIYGFGHKRAVADDHFNAQKSHKQDGHIGEVELSGRIVFTEKTENVEINKRHQQVTTTAKRLKFL